MELFFHHDCKYYRGDIPCKPHKEHGYHCMDCPAYSKITKRILIIKLGAIGDVIRTTPLLRRYRKQYPGCFITWLTLTPGILPAAEVDEILAFDLKSLTYLQQAVFDIALNLDKEKEAGALFLAVRAKKKFGYILKDNVIQPVNPLAVQKFATGMFDDVSKENRLSYCEEIFAVCGLKYEGEKYVFDDHSGKGFAWKLPKGKKIIGLNTGCGERWTTRLWSNEHWIELIKKIKKAGHTPLLLGGEQEHTNNLALSKKSGALYLGHFTLDKFINLMDQCHLVVTQVTMAMHIGIALGKKIVLMNNIFNKHEFDLFGKGKIIEPDKPCDCFYKGSCIHGASCMKDLPPEKVFKAIIRLI